MRARGEHDERRGAIAVVAFCAALILGCSLDRSGFLTTDAATSADTAPRPLDGSVPVDRPDARRFDSGGAPARDADRDPGDARSADRSAPDARPFDPPPPPPPPPPPAPPPPPSPVDVCNGRFSAAPGYALCGADAVSCAFSTSADMDCATMCRVFGSLCVGGFEVNDDDGACAVGDDQGCSWENDPVVCLCRL